MSIMLFYKYFYMKTTMTISVEEDLKKAFFTFSKQIWTNPTNLVNMLMQNTVSTREVNFRANNFLDLEIEEFSEDEIKSFWEDFIIKTNENTKRLGKLLANI